MPPTRNAAARARCVGRAAVAAAAGDPPAYRKESAAIMRDVTLAFVRLHILHHAAEGPIFGLEMIEELRRHGYRIGPGTIYPIFHGLEAAGMLRSSQEVVAGKVRRYYRATQAGGRLLRALRAKISELVSEVGLSSIEPP